MHSKSIRRLLNNYSCCERARARVYVCRAHQLCAAQSPHKPLESQWWSNWLFLCYLWLLCLSIIQIEARSLIGVMGKIGQTSKCDGVCVCRKL